MLTNIVDGFLDNLTTKYLPDRATPYQLGQLDGVRRANNLRMYSWVLPERVQDAIAARGQFEQEIRVIPNSYLFAIGFWEFETPGEESEALVGAGVAPDHFSLQITDQSAGDEIASEFISSRLFWPSTGEPRTRMPYCLLDQPRIVAGSGLLSVRIANTDSLPHFCQLVLYFVEPCESVDQRSQCP